MGSCHITVIASSVTLVFATAMSPPNRIISGSLWNCGAPPDAVMTVATRTAETTLDALVAASAPSQSTRDGGAPWSVISWKTASVRIPTNAKWKRLYTILSGERVPPTRRAAPDPTTAASR